MNRLYIFLVGSISLVTLISPVQAQSGGGYDLSWSTVDGGGGTSTNGGYTLSGTIGQPDAGTMSNGPYTLVGGFWSGTSFCLVDIEDLANFIQQWLENGPDLAADLNGDGKVDLEDYTVLSAYWMAVCPGGWPW
jgi:hypothetical protein